HQCITPQSAGLQECGPPLQLCAHFGVESVSEALLDDAASMPTTLPREGWVPPEAQLVRKLLSQEEPQRSASLHALQVSWRALFCRVLLPSHLPDGWQIDHAPFTSAQHSSN
ncbi:MAG: hypothetical protein SGPRY_012073, partial [Prymnesium sp.]